MAACSRAGAEEATPTAPASPPTPTAEPAAAPAPQTAPVATPAPTQPPAQQQPQENQGQENEDKEDPELFRAATNVALQEHAYLLAEAAYARVSRREPQAEAARAVLEAENTPLVRDLMSAGLTFNQRDDFANAWHAWTTMVMDYADAHARDDQERVSAIWGERFRMAARISDPLARGLGNVDHALLQSRMAHHVELTLGMVNIMHSRPPIDGYWGAWHTTDYLRPSGDQLAEGLVLQVPHRFAAVHDGAPTTLTSEATVRNEFRLLLHEYGLLLMNTTAAVVDGRVRGDTIAARDTLDARNSIPFTRLLGAYHGPTLEAEVLLLWREHIYAVMGYADALRNGSESGQAFERQRLDQTMRQLAQVLARANPRLDRSAMEEMLLRHGEFVLETVVQQHADRGEAGYVAALAVARSTEELAEMLTDALVGQFSARMAVENALYASTAAWSQGRPVDYLAYWNDAAVRDGWGQEEALQYVSETVGQPASMVHRIMSVDITGDTAVAEWTGLTGIAYNGNRTTLINGGGTWRIQSTQAMETRLPRGVNRVVNVIARDAGLDFDHTLLNGTYTAFTVENRGRRPYEVVLLKLPDLGQSLDAMLRGGLGAGGSFAGEQKVVSTGVIQAGGSANLSFTVPLAPGRYAFVTLKHSPSEIDPVQAMSAEFVIPYIPPRS